MEKVHTTCIYCGCGCGLFLHVEDGRVVGASPSPLHPMSKGRLCIKGWLAGEFVGHPDRLRYPLIRKDDRLLRGTWEEALSVTTASLRKIAQESGPGSLGILASAMGTNEENYLLMKLARAALKTNNVDHVASLCQAPTLTSLSRAFGNGVMTNPIASLAQATAILVVGSNTTERHPLVASYILEARSKGARLVVADPRKTQIADLADLHLAPRTGTDIAWINALLSVIIQKNLIDQEFIDTKTEGFDAVRQTVLGCTPEKAEEISGIPARDLIDAARIFGSAERAAVVYADGITQHITGTDNVQALANLVLATGNIGREGTGLYPLGGHQNAQGACDMGALPDFFCGYQKTAQSRQKFEQAWQTELPDEPGLTALEMLALAEDGHLKGLFVVGENPIMSYLGSSRIKKALEGLELLAVCDIFPTETSELADVVFPAASFAEKDGSFTSAERRIQRIRRAVKPPGEARAEWEIICDLLNKLGVPANYACAAEIMEEIAFLTPQYGGVSYDRLGVCGLQWPCPTHDHPGTGVLHAEKFSIGRARFRAVEHSESVEATDDAYPLLLSTGRSLYHFQFGTMTRRTSLLDREVPPSVVEINPEDAESLGIWSGQTVMVETRQGSISLEARVTEDTRKGSIFVPFHFSKAPANALTAQARDLQSKIPEFKVSAARIRRA